MQTVEQIARAIVAREGGFVNDPDDPGGATNRGVTIGTARRLGLDLDGDGDVDVSDVKKITAQLAEEIFVREYFERPRIKSLPLALHATVFDMQVNAGSRAVRILQELLIEMGEDISVDGAIGPQTIGAAARVYAWSGEGLVDAYGIARRNYYYALGDARASLRKFACRRDGGKGGWITRAEEFIAPRFHLSAAEHVARVRAWG